MKTINQSNISEMEIFSRVVETGNFSSAARSLQMDPSTISKLMLRLENRLGVRLMHRTTRHVVPTEEGEKFYHQITRILADIKEAEASLSTAPKGKVRITCAIPFALHQLLPILAEFIHTYPSIDVDLLSTDTVVDIYAERCDIAIRIGKLSDSSLKMRKLAESKMVIVASPRYIKRFGMPKNISDLNDHTCLNIHGHPELNRWPFKIKNKTITWHANSNFSADNGQSVVEMVLAGGGIARLSAYMVREYLNQGRLVSLLDKFNPQEWQQIYLLHPGHIPLRVQCVIDFIFAKLGNKRFR